MSNKETKEEFLANVNKAADLETLKQENIAKKTVIESQKLEAQLDQINQNKKDLEIAKNTNFGVLTAKQVEDIQIAGDEYFRFAKNAMIFICDAFKKVVPFFRKNFILIGAKTGAGKSTAVANIAFGTITQVNPQTGKTRRALVLTNEERAEDFYNRITCLIKGWHYTNHDKFTDEQVKTFREFIPKLASNGRLTVVDNNHNGSHGVTTSIEGIETVFENLIANNEFYDVVIIDYYQNIISSKKNPYMSENEVQARLSRMMDKYKNIYPAPIVMMCQINQPDKDDKVPFQQRIKGRKIIMDPATIALEMVADPKNLRTKWIVHKSRYTEAIGSDFWTGYEFGKFIEYTTAFAEKVQKMAYEKEARKINQTIDQSNGLKDVKPTGGNDDVK